MMNPLNRLSIRLRLGLLAGLALLLFALAGAYTTQASLHALERVHGERVVETASVILARMGSIVAARMDQLARAGQIDPVRAALVAAAEHPPKDTGGARPAVLNRAASEALRNAFIMSERRLFGRTVFDAVQVTDRHGRLVASTRFSGAAADAADQGGVSGSPPDWWLTARRTGRAVMGVRSDPDDPGAAAGLRVAMRLDALDGRMLGIAHATLSAAWIAREAATATQLSQPFDILLTTRDGRLIFSRRPFRFLESIADRPLFRLARDAGGFFVQNEGGRGRLVAHARNPNAPVIGELGWSLFISADRAIVLADTIALQRTLLLVFVFVLVLVTLMTVLLVLSLVRPLTGLRLAARAVADGDLSVRVRPRGRDELAELGQAFNTMAARIEANDAELRALAVTDALTGVLNRRGFMQRARIEWERCRRHNRPLAVLALDIDHFKAVNDSLGHDAGDAVLRGIAACLTRDLRPSDVVGRLGGEEFAVLLPETPAEPALALAERLRAAIAATPFRAGSRTIAVTVSIGAAQTDAEIDPARAGFERLLKQADEALYAAKGSGRDRVVPAAPVS